MLWRSDMWRWLNAHRVWLMVLAGVFLALLAWWTLSTVWGRQLNAEKFVLVKVGMTQGQVEELLGGPPGDYGRNRGGQCLSTLEGAFGRDGSVEKVWFDDNRRFEVWFDDADKVVYFHKRAHFHRSKPDSLVRRVLAFLGL